MTSATKTTEGRQTRPSPGRQRTARRSKRHTPPLRTDFGLTRKTLARMTGLSERTLTTWEAGGGVNEVGRRAIVTVERLLRALTEVVRKEAVAEWLEQPNEGFGDLKPLEVVERGEADRLWRMIYFVGAGTAS
ncbi:MAG TPA: helix-turn-helix transcriptional regulator [Gemmataceae bacterium]|nr:helix-turn-helix transcriptional regulator [Gemmataceae bacterium]